MFSTDPRIKSILKIIYFLLNMRPLTVFVFASADGYIRIGPYQCCAHMYAEKAPQRVSDRVEMFSVCFEALVSASKVLPL